MHGLTAQKCTFQIDVHGDIPVFFSEISDCPGLFHPGVIYQDVQRAERVDGLFDDVIGVSLLQAVIAAIGMSAAKVPGASLITVLILALGIVQVGPWPVCVLLIAWGWMNLPTLGAFAFTLCMLTVGLIENIAKPFALSHGLKTPMPVTFFGVIGGVMTHGIGGLFMGPVVLAVAWELLKTWIEEEKPA